MAIKHKSLSGKTFAHTVTVCRKEFGERSGHFHLEEQLRRIGRLTFYLEIYLIRFLVVRHCQQQLVKRCTMTQSISLKHRGSALHWRIEATVDIFDGQNAIRCFIIECRLPKLTMREYFLNSFRKIFKLQ